MRLDERWIRELGDLPESGMGYQRVNVRLRNGQYVRHVLVFNAELMEWPDDRAPIRPADVAAISLAPD